MTVDMKVNLAHEEAVSHSALIGSESLDDLRHSSLSVEKVDSKRRIELRLLAAL